jgi:methylamine dehydrogenase accessory protein MauD
MNAAFFTSYVALWILVVLQTVVVVVAIRQIGVLHLRLGGRGAMALSAGPPIGQSAPSFVGLDIDGKPVESPWNAGKSSLLVFVSPGCGACPEVIPSIRAIRRSDRRHVEILLISATPGDGNVEFARKSHCPVIVDSDLVSAYSIDAMPYAMAIDRDGVVRAKGIVNQIEHLEGLLDHLSWSRSSNESVEVSDGASSVADGHGVDHGS